MTDQDPRIEEQVTRMIEDGTGPIFKIIRPNKEVKKERKSNQKANLTVKASDNDIDNAAHTLYDLVRETKQSPRSRSGGTPTSKDRYDIQGYYKKINDMM